MSREWYKFNPLPSQSSSAQDDRSGDDGNAGQARGRYIRLLSLWPGSFSDQLISELTEYRLPDTDVEATEDTDTTRDSNIPTIRRPHAETSNEIKYEALSYHWGSISPSCLIAIMDNKKPRYLRITPNLDKALRSLRYEHDTRVLWIDSICINQKDNHEKSEQIPLMDRIYIRAENVCVWLGDEDQTSVLAFKHIKEVLNLRDFDGTVIPGKADAWAALAELMKRDWFSRRWIVQEIAFAKKATVHCGKQHVPWNELADAVALFGSRAQDISELFRKDIKYNHRADYLGDVEALGANRLVTTISKLFRKADDGRRVERLLPLEALVSDLSAFSASVPHDIIYAVLSLAKDVITSARTSTTDEALGLGPSRRRAPSLNIPPRNATSYDPSLLQVASPIEMTHGHTFMRSPEMNAVLDGRYPVASRRQSINSTASRSRRLSTSGVSPSPKRAKTSHDADWPEGEAEAMDLLRRSWKKDDRLDRALKRVKAHAPGIIEGLEYFAVTDGAKSAGLREAEIIAQAFWTEEIREQLKKPNGLARTTDALLQWQMDLAEGFVRTLGNRVKEKTFHVDYAGKSFYEVCQEFIEFTIRSSRSLDMLCRPWAPAKGTLEGQDDELPSWVCRLDKSPFRPRPDGNFGRANADVLVGIPASGGRIYSASALTKPEDCAMSKGSGKSLFVYGFVLDSIEELQFPAIEGNVPNEWLKLAGWNPYMKPKGEDPPESFWRTLVADRDDKGHNPPWYYRRACQHAFAQRVTGGSLNTERLMTSESSKIMTDYLRRVQSVVWNRRLMKTSKGGRLGLAPHNAEKGDYICILRGCSVPVILREIPSNTGSDILPTTNGHNHPSSDSAVVDDEFRGSTVDGTTAAKTTTPRHPSKSHGPASKIRIDGAKTCELIGESYVHGVMDGEGFRIRDKHELPEWEFELI